MQRDGAAMERTCYIFGAGDYGGQTLTAAGLGSGLIIAADGGYARLKQWGITPHLAVGDFDSLGRVPEDTEVIRYPVMKDDPDMMLAAQEGLARGCRRFVIYGGLGGRLDHTLANLHVLASLAQRGCAAFLLGEDTAVTAVHNGVLTFGSGQTGTLSLFAWGGQAAGISLSGLLYPLTDGVMTADRPLGLSNEFLGTGARVSVADGTLIVLWPPGEVSLPLHSN